MDTVYENRINVKELLASGKVSYISSEEALSDVTPIEWSDDVLNGLKKITVTFPKDKQEESK